MNEGCAIRLPVIPLGFSALKFPFYSGYIRSCMAISFYQDKHFLLIFKIHSRLFPCVELMLERFGNDKILNYIISLLYMSQGISSLL